MKGNGTCALSSKTPQPGDLQLDADYDVYVKSQRSPHCESDRLYGIGKDGIGGQERRNETRPTTSFGSGLLGPTMPSVLSFPRYDDCTIINFKRRTIPPLAFPLFSLISVTR